MTPTTARKGVVCYRYYVSAALIQGRKRDAGSVARVSAPEVEAVVLKTLRETLRRSAEPQALHEEDSTVIEAHVERVTIGSNMLGIILHETEASTSRSITVPWTTSFSARRRQIIAPQAESSASRHPIRSESRARLIQGIAKGRYWLQQLISRELTHTTEIAHRENCSDRQVRMTMSLAFVRPEIVKGAIDCSLPRGLGVASLIDLPADWERQSEVISSELVKS